MIRELKNCKFSIKMATDDYIKKDQWKYHPNVSYIEFHEEIAGKVRRFVDHYMRCSDLFLACKHTIRCHIIDRATFRLPKTNNTTRIDNLLMNKETMIIHLVNERNLTDSWIKDNHPEIYNTIYERLEEKPADLNTFFYDLGKMLENDKVLDRFMKEKEELIRFSENIQKSLDLEIQKF